MWTKTYSTMCRDISSKQMWKLFSNVNDWPTWDKNIDYTNMTGNFEKGNSFTLKPKGGFKVKVTLIEVVQNKKFTDVTHFPLAKMYDEHKFEETSQGLKITNTLSVERILGFLWIKLVAENIVKAWPQEIANQILVARTL